MPHKQLLEEALANAGEITAHRRRLHACPGVGFDLEDTTAYINEALTALGYTPRRCGKAGLVAVAGGKRPGKTLLLRADMDALPMREESGLPFAAQNGCAHACGHDLHAAMLLGAARLLKQHEEELCGAVKLMFQPAEELLAGAEDMLKNGVLNDPTVDAAVMLHVLPGLPLPPGTVIVPPAGPGAPAADYFEIHVQGKGCHGSMPHNGVDALTAAAHIVVAFQEIHARELPLGERAVLTIGTLQGGTAANALADAALLTGTLRAFDDHTRALLKRRMEEIAKSIAAAFRAGARVEYTAGCPVLVNDPGLTAAAETVLQPVFEERCLPTAKLAALFAGEKNTQAGGSEDFAYVSRKVPTLMLALAGGRPEQGYCFPLHHPKVVFDESALPYGAAAYAVMGMELTMDS